MQNRSVFTAPGAAGPTGVSLNGETSVSAHPEVVRKALEHLNANNNDNNIPDTAATTNSGIDIDGFSNTRDRIDEIDSVDYNYSDSSIGGNYGEGYHPSFLSNMGGIKVETQIVQKFSRPDQINVSSWDVKAVNNLNQFAQLVAMSRREGKSEVEAVNGALISLGVERSIPELNRIKEELTECRL